MTNMTMTKKLNNNSRFILFLVVVLCIGSCTLVGIGYLSNGYYTIQLDDQLLQQQIDHQLKKQHEEDGNEGKGGGGGGEGFVVLLQEESTKMNDFEYNENEDTTTTNTTTGGEGDGGDDNNIMFPPPPPAAADDDDDDNAADTVPIQDEMQQQQQQQQPMIRTTTHTMSTTSTNMTKNNNEKAKKEKVLPLLVEVNNKVIVPVVVEDEEEGEEIPPPQQKKKITTTSSIPALLTPSNNKKILKSYKIPPALLLTTSSSSSNNEYEKSFTFIKKIKKDDDDADDGIIINNTNNTTKETVVTVTVGKQGDAVKSAIINGLIQMDSGTNRNMWDQLSTSICLNENENEEEEEEGHRISNNNNNTNNNNNNNIINKSKSKKNPNNQKNRTEYLPQAILIGVQKGGTTALYAYLDQHPNIAISKTKEYHYLDDVVDKFVLDGGGIGGIPRRRVQNAYGQRIFKDLIYPFRDKGKLILDCTPRYMFASDKVPQRISCLVPNAKILALLRNPIHRARSQYDFRLNNNMNWYNEGKLYNTNQFNLTLPTFDEYIKFDINALKEIGVIQDWNEIDFDTYYESDASHYAWKTYINSGLNAPIGMGLYVLQLRYYFKKTKLLNNNNINNNTSSTNPFMAISSERLQHNTNHTYQRILDFLNVPQHAGVVLSKTVNSAKSKGRSTKISNETYDLLKDVFEPFNRKLGELLGGEWPNIISNEW